MLGGAGLLAYWSRTRPVEVKVVYVLGARAAAVERVEVSFKRDGEEMGPADHSWPEGNAPRVFRSTMKLLPGDYVIEAVFHLRGGKVRRVTQRVAISGSEQRLTLRLRRR